MTQTVDRADRTDAQPFADPLPRRSFSSRLSLGHLVMIVSGLIAFLLVLAVLRDRAETVFIAVAATDIEAGTQVDPSTFRMTEISGAGDGLLDEFLTQADVNLAVEEEWVTNRSIPAGAPVDRSDFRTSATGIDLRAMSIPINPGHAASGVLRQGDRVDIIVVRNSEASYVAVDVEVIAVSSQSSAIGSQGAFDITVAVDAETSQRIAVALNDGSMEIVRSTGAVPVDPAITYNPYRDSSVEISDSDPADGQSDGDGGDG